MRLMVAGSRCIGADKLCIEHFIPDDADSIITGGMIGVDALAEQYADENELEKIVVLPKYELYGKTAPVRRNREMVNMADRVLVFWDGKSRGAKFIYDYAKETGTPVDMLILKM